MNLTEKVKAAMEREGLIPAGEIMKWVCESKIKWLKVAISSMAKVLSIWKSACSLITIAGNPNLGCRMVCWIVGGTGKNKRECPLALTKTSALVVEVFFNKDGSEATVGISHA